MLLPAKTFPSWSVLVSSQGALDMVGLVKLRLGPSSDHPMTAVPAPASRASNVQMRFCCRAGAAHEPDRQAQTGRAMPAWAYKQYQPSCTLSRHIFRFQIWPAALCNAA